MTLPNTLDTDKMPRRGRKVYKTHVYKTPISRLMADAQLRRIDVSARSGVSLPTIGKLCRDDPDIYGMQISTLLRVSNALGCAAAELIPQLVTRPRTGLLWERAVFREKRS